MSNYPYGDSVSEFHVGDRVEVHPGTSFALSGYRFGEVKEVGRKAITAELHRLGHVITVKLHPGRLKVVTD